MTNFTQLSRVPGECPRSSLVQDRSTEGQVRDSSPIDRLCLRSWPNHMFSMSGTSAGCTETGSYYGCGLTRKLFPQKTIFQSLAENGHSYKLIYNDSRADLMVEFLSSDEAAANTHNMDEFFHDAEHGTLPSLTWISPREGVNASLGDLGGPNSDHPSCCDIALGERLRKVGIRGAGDD